MRKIDAFVLLVGIFCALMWVLISTRDGFKANNATIAARSISIVSTIDGQVENNPPQAGMRVDTNDVLISIRNLRLDKSRLAEFDSEIAFLRGQIDNIEQQQVALTDKLATYLNRDQAYFRWMQREAEFRAEQTQIELEIARHQQELTEIEFDRASQLSSSNLLSNSSMQAAQTAAKISESQIKITEAQLRRVNTYVEGLSQNGVFFENGDASYWSKMADTLDTRLFENANQIATLKLQLVQVQAQAEVERERISSSFVEIHRAPFHGMINAVFVKKDTRVTAGTNLYQILDCTRPVIIIPIPDNRVSEFSVGLRVTVYPTDTEEAYAGKISYVTSGALIGADTSLQIQQGLTLGGNRAVVALDDDSMSLSSPESCETERKAVVVVHTKTWYNEALSWTRTKFPRLATIIE